MAERYKFSVAYEPATLKSAVRAYLLRSMLAEHTWLSTAAISVIVVAAELVLFARAFDFLTGLFAGLATAALLLVAIVAWSYFRASRASLARMKTPRAEFRISDEMFEVATDMGSGRYRWEAIRQIWKFKQVWLLMFDLNRFVTLPLAGAPAEALQFLDEKVQPQPFKAA